MAVIKTGLEEMKPVAVREEVPKEEVPVKHVGTMRKRHGYRNLAVGRRGQPKKRDQGKGGFPEEVLAAARRKMTRSARGAWRKGRSHEGPTGRDNVVQLTRNGRTFG
jgi:hypothetical protein